MNGTIYDFAGLPRVATFGLNSRVRANSRPEPATASVPARVGLISNPRSRRNKLAGGVPPVRLGVLAAAPGSRAELRDVMVRFAGEGVNLLIVDGGDGTVTRW